MIKIFSQFSVMVGLTIVCCFNLSCQKKSITNVNGSHQNQDGKDGDGRQKPDPSKSLKTFNFVTNLPYGQISRLHFNESSNSIVALVHQKDKTHNTTFSKIVSRNENGSLGEVSKAEKDQAIIDFSIFETKRVEVIASKTELKNPIDLPLWKLVIQLTNGSANKAITFYDKGQEKAEKFDSAGRRERVYPYFEGQSLFVMPTSFFRLAKVKVIRDGVLLSVRTNYGSKVFFYDNDLNLIWDTLISPLTEYQTLENKKYEAPEVAFEAGRFFVFDSIYKNEINLFEKVMGWKILAADGEKYGGFLTQLNDKGEVTWRRGIFDNINLMPKSLFVDADGVLTLFDTVVEGHHKGALYNLQFDGSKNWEAVFSHDGKLNSQYSQIIRSSRTGNIIVGGICNYEKSSQGSFSKNGQPCVAVIDKFKNPTSMKTIKRERHSGINTLALTSNDEILFGGFEKAVISNGSGKVVTQSIFWGVWN